MPFIPSVIERSESGEKFFDILSRLLKERIVFCSGPVEDGMANMLVAQLLFLEAEDKTAPVHMYINSPGGVITAGLSIYDTMQKVSCPVSTIVMGQACSMGAVLLAGGAAGLRFSLPHSRIMIHQPRGGQEGTSIDLEIQMKEMIHLRDELYEILSKHTGRSTDDITKACDRDNFMNPVEALNYGLIDKVIE